MRPPRAATLRIHQTMLMTTRKSSTTTISGRNLSIAFSKPAPAPPDENESEKLLVDPELKLELKPPPPLDPATPAKSPSTHRAR